MGLEGGAISRLQAQVAVLASLVRLESGVNILPEIWKKNKLLKQKITGIKEKF